MKKKNLSLKEIHQYLIDNNYFHYNEDYLIKKGIILKKESNKEKPASLPEKSQILSSDGEIYWK
tara:strand:- start:113 stop:304 length:192 start_codon:yes stop_codon:yes gene_type:complete